MIEARFDYAGPFKSCERAEEVLSNMFAAGEVCEGERPLIERRKPRIESKYRSRYYITLPM